MVKEKCTCNDGGVIRVRKSQHFDNAEIEIEIDNEGFTNVVYLTPEQAKRIAEYILK